MNLPYFFEKNSLMVIILVAVSVSVICIWVYLDFSRDMQSISDFTSLNNGSDVFKISKVSPEVIKNISTSTKPSEGAGNTVSPEVLKMLSANSKIKSKAVEISADVLKSLSATK